MKKKKTRNNLLTKYPTKKKIPQTKEKQKRSGVFFWELIMTHSDLLLAGNDGRSGGTGFKTDLV